MPLSIQSKQVLLSLTPSGDKDELSYLDSINAVNNAELVEILQTKIAIKEKQKLEDAADHILNLIKEVDEVKLRQRNLIRSLRRQADDKKNMLNILEAALTYSINSGDYSAIIDALHEAEKNNITAMRSIQERIKNVSSKATDQSSDQARA